MADFDTAKGEECLMDVGTAFKSDAEATVLVQPTVGAFDHPAMTSQALTGVDALAGDAHSDVPSSQCCPATRIVVAFVGMELVGTLAPLSPRLLDGWDVKRLGKRLKTATAL